MKHAVNLVALLVLAAMTWGVVAWDHAALSAFCGFLFGVQLLITALDVTSDMDDRRDDLLDDEDE